MEEGGKGPRCLGRVFCLKTGRPRPRKPWVPGRACGSRRSHVHVVMEVIDFTLLPPWLPCHASGLFHEFILSTLVLMTR